MEYKHSKLWFWCCCFCCCRLMFLSPHKCTNPLLFLDKWFVRIDLRPLYTTVEKCIARSRVLAQVMVIWGKGWYAGEDGKPIKYFIQVGVLRGSSFLSKALRLPKKLDLRRSPLLKSVRHDGIHVIFSSMNKVLHQRTLGCSANQHRTRVLLSANQIFKIPLEFMSGGLLHHSVKRP